MVEKHIPGQGGALAQGEELENGELLRSDANPDADNRGGLGIQINLEPSGADD